MSETSPRKERLYYIDFLKCAGLLLIIFAHIGAPDALSAIRTFDVPLMVILSSLLAARSYERKKTASVLPLHYFLQRIQRLVIPTWILLAIYFLLQYLLTGTAFAPQYYLYSFALTRYGAGYVWIILIYLYSALLVPLFSRLQPTLKTLFSFILVYILYETAYYFRLGTDNRFIETFFYYIIPYGCLSFAGYSYEKLSLTGKKILIGVSFITFAVTSAVLWYKTGELQSPGAAKYPAQIYYVSYGLSVSFFLIFLCERKNNSKLFRNRAVHYISSHSLWIYLWHIITLLLYKTWKLPEIWYVKFIIITLSSVAVTFLVNKALDLIEKKRKYPFLRYFRG